MTWTSGLRKRREPSTAQPCFAQIGCGMGAHRKRMAARFRGLALAPDAEHFLRDHKARGSGYFSRGPRFGKSLRRMPAARTFGTDGNWDSIYGFIGRGYASLPGSLAGRRTKGAPDRNLARSDTYIEEARMKSICMCQVLFLSGRYNTRLSNSFIRGPRY